MNVEAVMNLRNLHKSLEAESKELLSQIQELDAKRMSSGNVITPELSEIYQKIESLFSKKSKVDQKARTIQNEIMLEVLKD